nr:hypothetical protein FVER53263_20272 [Fusarium verticillioides]
MDTSTSHYLGPGNVDSSTSIFINLYFNRLSKTQHKYTMKLSAVGLFFGLFAMANAKCYNCFYAQGSPPCDACPRVINGGCGGCIGGCPAAGTTGASSCAERRVLTIRQPIGVAVALVPWNFPIAMIMRKASAAFAAGCSMIVKPSPKTPLSCLALADLATRAGFPAGTFNVLTTSLENTPSLSEALCTHPLVAKVTFTGSTRVGKIVSGLCAQGLKKCTLELGGNCPVIVFDDADFGQAIDQIMALK